MALSSRVRSRINACAFSGSSQSVGSSASPFSSSRRLFAASQSKTPPQQGQRLPHLLGFVVDLGAHVGSRGGYAGELGEGARPRKRRSATLYPLVAIPVSASAPRSSAGLIGLVSMRTPLLAKEGGARSEPLTTIALQPSAA